MLPQYLVKYLFIILNAWLGLKHSNLKVHNNPIINIVKTHIQYHKEIQIVFNFLDKVYFHNINWSSLKS